MKDITTYTAQRAAETCNRHSSKPAIKSLAGRRNCFSTAVPLPVCSYDPETATATATAAACPARHRRNSRSLLQLSCMGPSLKVLRLHLLYPCMSIAANQLHLLPSSMTDLQPVFASHLQHKIQRFQATFVILARCHLRCCTRAQDRSSRGIEAPRQRCKQWLIRSMEGIVCHRSDVALAPARLAAAVQTLPVGHHTS